MSDLNGTQSLIEVRKKSFAWLIQHLTLGENHHIYPYSFTSRTLFSLLQLFLALPLFFFIHMYNSVSHFRPLACKNFFFIFQLIFYWFLLFCVFCHLYPSPPKRLPKLTCSWCRLFLFTMCVYLDNCLSYSVYTVLLCDLCCTSNSLNSSGWFGDTSFDFYLDFAGKMLEYTK